MDSQNESLALPANAVYATAANTSRSKALDLASSLIQASGDDVDIFEDRMVTLSVTRPSKAQYFRIHPTLLSDVNLLKVDGASGEEVYAVVPSMVKSLDNVQLHTLFFGVHRDGSHFLWPVNATSNNPWASSARQIAAAAMHKWCRIVSDRAQSRYHKRESQACADIPSWPTDKSFPELLVLAFGDGHIIDSPEHPVVKDMWLQ